MKAFRRIRKLALLSLTSLLFNSTAQSQTETFIVKIKGGKPGTQFDSAHFKVGEEIIADLGIYLVHADRHGKQQKSKQTVLERLRSQPNVVWAQKDHPVTLRALPPSSSLVDNLFENSTTDSSPDTLSRSQSQPQSQSKNLPNDPEFAKTWGLYNPVEKVDIEATKAWERHGPGGTDRLGHKIVLGLSDDGLDITHRDIKNNLWINKAEIPGNGKDDDQNGLIDDIHGWNFTANSPNIPAGHHGTHVAGTMAAEGNNSLNVSGVNWQSEVMVVTSDATVTSQVLKSYGYFLQQKKLWLSSGQREGANVVATNSSWGIDYADCDGGDYPAWNHIYNEMGKVGILSVAATINSNVDVDQEGDVPTGCSSPYIIGVTNITRQGQKYDGAGFGKINIDLGAPGTDVYSIIPGDRSDTMTGTSMATPHVTGSVGYLHSAASQEFAKLAIAQPDIAALELKKILLDSVSPQADLKDVTTSGGRLNLKSAADRLSQFKQIPKQPVP